MHSLIALSADGLCTPHLDVHPVEDSNVQTSFGWGIGWYPGSNTAAILHREPHTARPYVSSEEIPQAAFFRSKSFLVKILGGSEGYTHPDTQPFSKTFGGSEWLFAHSGELDKHGLRELFVSDSKFLLPLGRTDSELAFCYLLNQLDQAGVTSLQDLDPVIVASWFACLDDLGCADIILTDGKRMVCYHGKHSDQDMVMARFGPPGVDGELVSQRATLAFRDPRDTHRTKMVITTETFGSGSWERIDPTQLLMLSNGAVVWKSPSYSTEPLVSSEQIVQRPQPIQPQGSTTMLLEQGQTQQVVMNPRSITRSRNGAQLAYRTYEIGHITEYNYDQPVEHSMHIFRLKPVESSIQSVDVSTITISSPGEQIQFEDVFGNDTLHYTVSEPYTRLVVENRSRVKIYARPDDDVQSERRQATIPLVWMPWQRMMMMPYLLPQELPYTQLEELTSYAMSFVERNDFHLLDTLKDINTTLYRDYTYRQGGTSLETTPFDVYVNRVGVCQDFANLFICLARLLGIPARYQMGYIYTGAAYENKIQSEASHAWVDLYLPYLGWRGFDPTNGCLVGQEHICVACGRNYLDATPTSGTLFKGGGGETLRVSVQVQEVLGE